MPSPTSVTKVRRAIKKATCGKDRKNAVRKNGTTPKLFTLNKPVAAK